MICAMTLTATPFFPVNDQRANRDAVLKSEASRTNDFGWFKDSSLDPVTTHPDAKVIHPPGRGQRLELSAPLI